MDRVADWTLDERLPSESRVEQFAVSTDDGRHGRLYRVRGPALVSDDEREVFLRDVERLRGVSHDALLAVQGGGEHEGELYVVTAAPPANALSLFELRRRARARGGLSTSVVAHVGARVAHALAALHEAGVTHGALDARSVFIDEDGAVFLGGAGTAPLAGGLPDEPRGVPDDVRRAGTLLWEALVDRRLLFGGAEPPSRLRADVPDALDAALVRALDIDPTRRFVRASALADALGRVGADADTDALAELRALVTGTASPRPATPAVDTSGRVSRRTVDIPVFEPRPGDSYSPRRTVAGCLAGFIVLVTILVASTAWIATAWTWEPKMGSVAQAEPAPMPRGPAPTTIVLRGPGGEETLPPAAPRVFQVWLQGCADCMPKFKRVRDLRRQGKLDGLPIANVAFGNADEGWAKEWGVADNLVTDPGRGLVNPLRIGTFTSVVMFPDGRYRVLYPTDDYPSALRAALASPPTSGVRWLPAR